MRTLFIRYEGFKKRSDTLAAVLRVGGGREKEDEGENCISRTPGRRSEGGKRVRSGMSLALSCESAYGCLYYSMKGCYPFKFANFS